MEKAKHGVRKSYLYYGQHSGVTFERWSEGQKEVSPLPIYRKNIPGRGSTNFSPTSSRLIDGIWQGPIREAETLWIFWNKHFIRVVKLYTAMGRGWGSDSLEEPATSPNVCEQSGAGERASGMSLSCCCRTLKRTWKRSHEKLQPMHSHHLCLPTDRRREGPGASVGQ